MKVMIAGATGAIGRRLVPLLIEAGHQVTGTTRSDAGLEQLRAAGAHGVRLDVYDADAVKAAVAAAAPDVIMHQLTDLSSGVPGGNGRIRRIGSRNLVDAARQAAVPKMVAQSIAWAYEAGSGPAVETTPLDESAPDPRGATVSAIRALEDGAAELPEYVVLRYGLLYGPGTWLRRGGLADDVLRSERPAEHPGAAIFGGLIEGDGVFSLLHVDDAARAAVDALSWPSGAVNVVDDEPAPTREWLPVFAASVGAPSPALASGRRLWERGADNALARSLGWTPLHHSWRTGFSAE
ncbi:NAD(P)-dependent oxidoreductase [Kribbella pittospori]|uniref:NAD(P)-dependent oxidoreductase n=2 Tax=Kribbella pittospori TaxID=722689 RepID=A0A4R0KSA9_9ACTN|nr:NAD(P)-dependent oxidoreductase [Kribbella pittospori]